MNVSIKHSIRALNEASSWGIELSILKKTEKNTFETIMSPTTCRDYIQDLYYKYYTNTNPNEGIYGFRCNLDDYKEVLDAPYHYLLITDRGERARNEYAVTTLPDIDKESYLKYVNFYTEHFKFPKCYLEKATIKYDENYPVSNASAWILKFPSEFGKLPSLLSLLTLVSRVAITYKGEKSEIDYMFSYDKMDNNYSVITDSYTKENYDRIMEGKVTWEYSDYVFNDESIHNNSGIANCHKLPRDLVRMCSDCQEHLDDCCC